MSLTVSIMRPLTHRPWYRTSTSGDLFLNMASTWVCELVWFLAPPRRPTPWGCVGCRGEAVGNASGALRE